MDTTTNTTTMTAKPRRTPTPLNGVDTPKLFATLDVVRQQPDLARFQFRSTTAWLEGTHSRSRIESYMGAGAEQKHAREFTFDADHPPVLTGTDQGPTPVEFLLHALAACITAGIANVAAARGVKLTAVESTVEGDIDLRGILGLSPDVRNGYEGVRMSVRIQGEAAPETLARIVDQSRSRSAVYDVLTHGIPVSIAVNAG